MQSLNPPMPAPAATRIGAPSALRSRLVLVSLLLVTFLLMGAGVYALQVASASGLAAGYPMPHVSIDTSSIPGSIAVNQQVTFTASSPGRGLTYTWDFGDSSGTANGASVPHAFNTTDESNNFSYTVSVTVVDILGRTSSASVSVKVLPSPPVAQFTWQETDSYYYYVSFDASTSMYNTQNVSYSWDFGDPSSSSNSDTSIQPSHEYSATGSYTVTLTVTDDAGQSNTTTQTVTVQ